MPPYLAMVTNGHEVVGGALRTEEDKPLIVTRMSTDEIACVVEGAMNEGMRLKGVVGEKETANLFRGLWEERSGCGSVVHMDLGVYQSDRVLPYPSTPGEFRAADSEDLPLLCKWYEAFAVEAVGISDGPRVEKMVRRDLEDVATYLWVNGEPTAMAKATGETPNGIRITRVYTPPDLRGRGYATAVVAETSRRMLERGRKFCFLFTDLTNPTSNSIYKKIGYVHQCDFMHVNFEYPDG